MIIFLWKEKGRLPESTGPHQNTGSQPKPLKACDVNRFPRELPCPFDFFVYYILNAIFSSPCHCLGWVLVTFTINSQQSPCHQSRQTQPTMDFHKTFAFDGSKQLQWLSTAYRKDLDSIIKTFHSCLLFQTSLLPAVNSTFNTTGSLIATQICLDSANLPNFFLPHASTPPPFSVLITDGRLPFLQIWAQGQSPGLQATSPSSAIAPLSGLLVPHIIILYCYVCNLFPCGDVTAALCHTFLTKQALNILLHNLLEL